MCDRATSLHLLSACLLFVGTAASATTATPSVTPTGPLGHLTVRVAERSEGCTGSVSGITVLLQPGSLGAITGGFDNKAKFTVPPGSYTLSVNPSCNDFGCWSEQVVIVATGDQSITLCPLAGDPTPTSTPTPTPESTGSLGTKTSVLHAFNLVTGASLAGAAVECSSPREARSGVTDVAGTFSCTLELRDSDAVLTVIGAPGFAERRRGYSGLDLWTNTLVLQFGLIPEGLCAGDCDGDHEVGINELVFIVNLALADGTSDGCPLADVDGDGRVAVNDVVRGVTLALEGCPIE